MKELDQVPERTWCNLVRACRPSTPEGSHTEQIQPMRRYSQATIFVHLCVNNLSPSDKWIIILDWLWLLWRQYYIILSKSNGNTWLSQLITLQAHGPGFLPSGSLPNILDLLSLPPLYLLSNPAWSPCLWFFLTLPLSSPNFQLHIHLFPAGIRWCILQPTQACTSTNNLPTLLPYQSIKLVLKLIIQEAKSQLPGLIILVRAQK